MHKGHGFIRTELLLCAARQNAENEALSQLAICRSKQRSVKTWVEVSLALVRLQCEDMSFGLQERVWRLEQLSVPLVSFALVRDTVCILLYSILMTILMILMYDDGGYCIASGGHTFRGFGRSIQGLIQVVWCPY